METPALVISIDRLKKPMIRPGSVRVVARDGAGILVLSYSPSVFHVDLILRAQKNRILTHVASCTTVQP